MSPSKTPLVVVWCAATCGCCGIAIIVGTLVADSRWHQREQQALIRELRRENEELALKARAKAIVESAR